MFKQVPAFMPENWGNRTMPVASLSSEKGQIHIYVDDHCFKIEGNLIGGWNTVSWLFSELMKVLQGLSLDLLD